MFNFLENFQKNGYLKNTAIIISSDHGLHYGLYLNTGKEDAKIEQYLPLLIIILHENWNRQIEKEELIKNQDKFIIPYDIYNTMLFIVKRNLK